MASRRIIRARDVITAESAVSGGGVGAGGGVKVPDDYLSKLIKLAPTEIVAAFLAIDGIVRATTMVGQLAYWGVFALLVVICVIWTAGQTREPGKPVAWLQVTLSTGAFVVWVHAIGGPFEKELWYNPALAGILVILYTFLIPRAVTS